MKLKYFALSVALVMALTLTGCSANRNDNGDVPTNSVTPGGNVQNSAGVDSGVQNSPSTGNDAMQGGGAGGTNDQNNDGHPDSSAGVNGNDSGSTGSTGTSVGRAADDIGRAAGDLARGAGNVVRDAGNAVGNAANNVGSTMR